MRIKQSLLAASAVSSLLACDRQVDTLSPAAPDAGADFAAAFVTSQPAQARLLVSQARLKPIITVGDPIPGQEANPDPEQRVWAPIPDGLGMYEDRKGLVLFANHELTSGGVDGHFPYARVSRLILDPASLGVKGGSYPITGTENGFLFQRLCSATFNGQAEGFGTGWFFTGEESTSGGAEGMQTAVKADGSETRKLPWLGRFAHENYIAVPGFRGKTVMIGTDDTSPATLGGSLRSELYMYLADNAAGVLTGTGKLYVFTSSAKANSGYLEAGSPIAGKFVEVPDATTLSASALQGKVDELNAFKFVRLEDVDYARSQDGEDDHNGQGKSDQARKGSSRGPAIYFVDTGNNNAICGAGPCDLYGSIYRMELDAFDPTQNARLVLLSRSRGVADGDWASPDNISVGHHSLMLMEDPAYAGFNRAERIWNFKLRNDGGLGTPKAIVELKTQELTGTGCLEPAGTCWESSGIIDASEWLGEGTWLFDIQAHTLPFSYQNGDSKVNVSKEGGQLLYLRLPGS